MSDPTFIACPHCGEPVVMTEMQLDLFRGRALACLKCAKQFTVDPQRTPLFRLSPGGRAYLSSPPPQEQEQYHPDAARREAPIAEPQARANSTEVASATSSSPRREKSHRGDNEARWKLPAYFAAGAALVALLLAVIVLPPMTTARAAQRQLNCASNLRQISIALQVYAADNNGQFPDTLASLVSANLLKPDALVCPTADSPGVPAPAPTINGASAPANALASYNYLGKGMTTAAASNPQTVIVYEPLQNHGAARGTHVLYANGTISFIVPPLAQQTVQALSVPGATTAPSPSGGPQ
jgi:type II secretory pathway pseudopilin PulG